MERRERHRKYDSQIDDDSRERVKREGENACCCVVCVCILCERLASKDGEDVMGERELETTVKSPFPRRHQRLP